MHKYTFSKHCRPIIYRHVERVRFVHVQLLYVYIQLVILMFPPPSFPKYTYMGL